MFAFKYIASTAGLGENYPILEAIRERFSADPQWKELLFVLTGMAALALLGVMASRFLSKNTVPSRQRTGEMLADALRLLDADRAERQLLRRMARSGRVAEPVAILLSPAIFARAATPLLEDDPCGEHRKRIENLCRKLFDAPLPSELEVCWNETPSETNAAMA